MLREPLIHGCLHGTADGTLDVLLLQQTETELAPTSNTHRRRRSGDGAAEVHGHNEGSVPRDEMREGWDFQLKHVLVR
jgi:hypothetical protein